MALPEASSSSAHCYRQCTAFRLDPPVENPVDVAVSGDQIAIADYEHGVLLVTAEGKITRKLNCSPYRICGVCFRKEPTQIVLLGYHESKWFIVVYSTPAMVKDCCIECPSDPDVISWAKRKISVFSDFVFVLATCETLSVVWSLHIPTSKWTTVLFEREQRAAYADMDVGIPFGERETARIVLCVDGKSRLKVVTLGPEGKILRINAIKVKRKKEQQWIVRGPKLVVCDENKDILVYDESGKMFWFDGATYRIRKIVGDIGRNEASAITVHRGWCYALCRHQLCIHGFLYKDLG